MLTAKIIRQASSQAWLNHEIIPRPSQAYTCPGKFLLNPGTIIVTDALAESVAHYLAEALAPATGFRLCVQTNPTRARSNGIEFQVHSGLSELGEEGYELSVQPDGIRIQAYRRTGLFYACQTLRQLLPKEILSAVEMPWHYWPVPCGIIRDQPRFAWRGLMLDVARHFLPKAFILRYLDLLALYKMNRLHLHLTDSVAWTLAIKRYPQLTVMNRWGPASSPARGTYSQQDIREIVKYAAARQIMVIPEIECPAHADAVMAAYPELLCANHPARTGGSEHKEFCPGRDDTYDFIDQILTEVVAIFESPFIHIGGDEYRGTAWEQCPDCQRRLQHEHLDAEDTPELRRLFRNCQGSPRKYLLYRYMMRRVAKMVVAKNRIPILWDDLSWRGAFPDQSVIMQWHYQGLFDWAHKANTLENPATEAINAGHQVIIASASHLYFNCCDGGALMQRLYDYEPAPKNLNENQIPYVLGPHACIWEHPQAEIDMMLFPRLLAMAERGWTAKPLQEWNDFALRLQNHYPRLNILGIQHSPPSTPEILSPTKMKYHWEITQLTKFKKEWLVNEVLTGNGCYELTFRFASGGKGVSIDAFWIEDGHAPIPLSDLHLPPNVALHNPVYRMTVSDFKPGPLYYVRVLFKGNAQSDCSGEFEITKLNQQNQALQIQRGDIIPQYEHL